jgi:hypothetical protein
MLQSTQGLLLLMTKQKRAVHSPMRTHGNDVSPMAAAVLADASSPGARRILFQRQRYKPAIPALPCVS